MKKIIKMHAIVINYPSIHFSLCAKRERERKPQQEAYEFESFNLVLLFKLFSHLVELG